MLENNTPLLPLATTISTDSSLLDSFLVSSDMAQVIAGRLAPNYMYNSTTILLPNSNASRVSGGLANPYSPSSRLEIFDELDVDRIVPMGGMTDVTTPIYATRRNFWGLRREVQIGTMTQYRYWTWLIDGYFSYGTTCERITYFSINWGHDDSQFNIYYLESEIRPQWQGEYAYLQNRKFIKYLFPQ